MDEQIRIYESLLNEKASLEKDCLHYSMEYAREFGEEVEQLFALKVEVVSLKKKIAFCVRKSYRNEPIYSNELDEYIDEEIMEYQRELQDLIEFNQAAKEKCVAITYEEHSKIKRLFRKIVHLIHPDARPEYKDDEEISELWNKALDAYKCNDYKTLAEVYDRIIIKVNDEDISIDNINEKIETLKEEISQIKDNTPYTYKFILADVSLIKDKHDDLKKEIGDFIEYKDNLEKELSSFNILIVGDA